MTDKNNPQITESKQGDVQIQTTKTGPDRYSILATATFNCSPNEVWALLWDWEQLLNVGLPGMTSNFVWLSGGPDVVPSRFQFEIAGTVIKEEIYERTSSPDRYHLRYKALEPALGILEYDAIIDLNQISGNRTSFSAIREIRLEPGAGPEMLADMVKGETQCLKDHFA